MNKKLFFYSNNSIAFSCEFLSSWITNSSQILWNVEQLLQRRPIRLPPLVRLRLWPFFMPWCDLSCAIAPKRPVKIHWVLSVFCLWTCHWDYLQDRIQRGLWLETVKSWSQWLAFSIWAESALWPFLIPQKLECISLLGLLWKRQQTREYRKHDLFHTLPEAEDLLPQGSGDAGSLLVTLGLARLAVLLF